MVEKRGEGDCREPRREGTSIGLAQEFFFIFIGIQRERLGGKVQPGEGRLEKRGEGDCREPWREGASIGLAQEFFACIIFL